MTKPYPVGIVGEANYQAAIRRCFGGQRVYVVGEPDNPYDNLALAVVTYESDTIGYIARDCWLRDAIHLEGRSCEAYIKEVSSEDGGTLGVVIEVTLCQGEIDTRTFERAKEPKF